MAAYDATIWQYLESKIENEYGVAGLMGNLYAESGLRPNNLQNSYETLLGFTDESYTTAVDNGSYSNFVNDSAGYGLAQWTYYSRKQGLYNLKLSRGVSISDITLQLDYLWQELTSNYTGVLSVLVNATSVRQASDIVLTGFESPADQSESVKILRASYGQGYYDTYADGGSGGGETSTDKILHVEADELHNVIYCSSPDISTAIGIIPNGEYPLLSDTTITGGSYEFYEISYLSGIYYVPSYPPYTYVSGGGSEIENSIYDLIAATPYKTGQLTEEEISLLKSLEVGNTVFLKFTFNHNKRQIGTNFTKSRLTFDSLPYIIRNVEKDGFLSLRVGNNGMIKYINPKYIKLKE